MSDDIRRDTERLAPGPLDPEEARRADELEVFLASAPARGGAGDMRPQEGDAIARLGSRASEEWLASVLLGLEEEIVPDSDFASDLQAQLERRIREGGHSGEAGGTATHGNDGSGNGQPRLPHETRARRNAQRYRPLWAALAAMVLLTILLALPPVRASLRQPLCLGSVCIVFDGAPQPAATVGPYASPTPTPLPSVLDLAGRTTLAQARARLTFLVRLPTYPADLGEPDYVFLQDLNGAAVVLAWVDREHPQQVRLSLSELSSGIYAYKFTSTPVAVTTVHGQRALWTTGPYTVQMQDGTYEQRRLVRGHVLIWTEGDITYRLETDVSLDDAVRIAESLR